MLARFLYIFILLFFIESDLLAQGMLFDSTKYQQIYFEEPRRETISRPDSFSLKKYAPTPLEQGDNNSCVACAIIHAYVISRNSCCINVSPSFFSTSFIYNRIKVSSNCKSGAFIESGLHFLDTVGLCPEASFPSSKISCASKADNGHLSIARNFKMMSESTTRITELGGGKKTILSALKNKIVMDIPVIVGMKIPLDLRQSKNATLDKNEKYANHAVVLTGYNDRTKQVELMNSYGPKWNGQQGYFYMDYDKFHEQLLTAFVFSMPPRVECQKVKDFMK